MVAKRERRNGRVRALRSMLLLTLGLVLLGALGAAGAQADDPPTVTATCDATGAVAVGTSTSCTGLVTAPNGGAAPTGTLTFFSFGFLQPASLNCTLAPVQASESSCAMPVTPRVGGFPQVLDVVYDQPGVSDLPFDLVTLQTSEGKMRVTCSPDTPVQGDIIPCQAFVPDTAGVAGHPTGTVQLQTFGGAGDFTSLPAGMTSCGLQAISNGSVCAFVWVAPARGRVAIHASYRGDATHPADNGSKVISISSDHTTDTEVTCDNVLPVAGTTITCTATVTNTSPTGAAPNGEVDFSTDSTGPGGTFPGPGGRFCDIAPVGNTASAACSVTFKPNAGRQFLTANYHGDRNQLFEFGSGTVGISASSN